MKCDSLKRFFNNECSPEERNEVVQWLLAPANDFVVRAWMKDHWEEIVASDAPSLLDNGEIQQLWMSIQREIGLENVAGEVLGIPITPMQVSLPPRKRTSFFFNKYVAAASIACLIAGYVFFHRTQDPKETVSRQIVPGKSVFHNEIKSPQSSTSVLMMEGGTKIYLDNVKSGLIATQNNVSLNKGKDGQLIYQGTYTDKLVYNTIAVPNGSKLQKVVLSDGTVIYLNAGTSITFPIAFMGNERRVSIDGEGYFEVSKNKNKPFYVSHNDVQVKVLGTHFNVNAYPDSKGEVKVTLLEGSVQVNKKKKQYLIAPGQEVDIEADRVGIQSFVNTNKVTAWKNEEFYFDGDDIVTIMNQVEKVYDVKVVYENIIPYSFVAKLSRNESLSSLLKVLELTNVVHFKTEGKRITVSN